MERLIVYSMACQVLDTDNELIIELLSVPFDVLVKVSEWLVSENEVSSLKIFASGIDIGWDRLLSALDHENCKIKSLQIYDIKPMSPAFTCVNKLFRKVNLRELNYTSMTLFGNPYLPLSPEMIFLVSDLHTILDKLTLGNVSFTDPFQVDELHKAIMWSNITVLDMTFVQNQDDVHDYTEIEKCVEMAPEYIAIRRRMSIMLNPACAFHKLPRELFKMFNELF